MATKISFEKVGSINQINDFRNLYLDELFDAQELYLELQIRNAQPYLIKLNSNPIGYFLLDDEATLLEYFVEPACVNQADSIFGLILETFRMQKALCKSFDHTLLACCMAFQTKVSVLGMLFREQVKMPLLDITNAVNMRLATPTDVPVIVTVNEEVFEKKEEIEETIQS